MTAPDGSIPGGSVNYGSLADFAAKTEEDWLAEMRGATAAPWEGLLDGFFFGLNQGQPFVLAIFEALADALGLGGVWDTVEGVLGDIGDFFGDLAGQIGDVAGQISAAVLDAFNKLSAALGLNGAWTTLTQAVNAIGGHIGNLATQINAVAGQISAAILQAFTDFAAALGLSGAWTSLTQVMAALGGWGSDVVSRLNAVAGQISAAILQAFKDFAAALGLTGAWTSLTQVLTSIGGSIAAITTNIVSAIAGAGKTTLADLTAWATSLVANFQALIDQIAQVFFPNIGSGRPISDAINAIAGILGVGRTAQSSADTANMGVARLEATQAGGSFDEFNYPVSNSLPSPWDVTYSGGAATVWGPDGSGRVMPKNYTVGVNVARECHYRLTTPAMTKADVTVTVVLAQAPANGLGFFFIEVQRSATDSSCVRAKIGASTCQFESISAAGLVSPFGPEHSIAVASAGDVYELKAAGTGLFLSKNGISQCSQGFSPLAGRQIGFGAGHTGYTWLSGTPAPGFAGIAWK